MASREELARVLLNQGAALGQAGRREEAVAAFNEAVDRFGDAADPALRRQVAMALVNKGVALNQLGRSGEALAAWAQVVGWGRRRNGPWTRRWRRRC